MPKVETLFLSFLLSQSLFLITDQILLALPFKYFTNPFTFLHPQDHVPISEFHPLLPGVFTGSSFYSFIYFYFPTSLPSEWFSMQHPELILKCTPNCPPLVPTRLPVNVLGPMPPIAFSEQALVGCLHGFVCCPPQIPCHNELPSIL